MKAIRRSADARWPSMAAFAEALQHAEQQRVAIDEIRRQYFVTAREYFQAANAAIKRMIGRSSRELKEIYGVTPEYSLTNMDAFLQGVRSPGYFWCLAL